MPNAQLQGLLSMGSQLMQSPQGQSMIEMALRDPRVQQMVKSLIPGMGGAQQSMPMTGGGGMPPGGSMPPGGPQQGGPMPPQQGGQAPDEQLLQLIQSKMGGQGAGPFAQDQGQEMGDALKAAQEELVQNPTDGNIAKFISQFGEGNLPPEMQGGKGAPNYVDPYAEQDNADEAEQGPEEQDTASKKR